jgi:hypothetical protein
MGCISSKKIIFDSENDDITEYHHDLASFYSHMNSLLSANRRDLESEETEEQEQDEINQQAHVEVEQVNFSVSPVMIMPTNY